MVRYTHEQQEFIDSVIAYYNLMNSAKYNYNTYDSYDYEAGKYKYQMTMLLNAPAGTGKSFVIKNLYETFKSQYKEEIIILAPTHKAVSILKQGNNLPVNTIHRFLEGKMEIDDNTGKKKFVFTLNFDRINNRLIIVDECSMINDEIYDMFLKISAKNMIIFVGDDLQLPPINEDLTNDEIKEDSRTKIKVISKVSKAFTADHSFKKYTFTENKRSLEKTANVMLDLARKACYLKKMPAKLIEKKQSEMLNDFKDKLGSDKSIIVLTYSNVSVNNYNKMIRSALFDKDVKDLEPYYIGEKLIYSGFVVKNKTKYYSNDIIIINSLDIVEIKLDYKRCKCLDKDFKISKCKKHGFYKGSETLKFHYIIDQYNNEWFKVIDKDRKKFLKLKNQFKSLCINNKGGWKSFYSFYEKYDPELKYNYAMTIHKSQGSQFHTVYVDRNNLINCCSKDQLLKVNGYYTAISRMQSKVYDLIN